MNFPLLSNASKAMEQSFVKSLYPCVVLWKYHSHSPQAVAQSELPYGEIGMNC